MELSANAQRLLDNLIAKQDTDERVPRTFTEADMLELALIVLTNMNSYPLDYQGQHIIGLSVAQFELAVTERD